MNNIRVSSLIKVNISSVIENSSNDKNRWTFVSIQL